MSKAQLPVSYEDLVRQQLENSKRMAPSSEKNFVSIKGKQFTTPSGQSDKGPMRVVIVGFTNVNTYFEGAYDPNQHQRPVCFAINNFLDKLAPHPKSEKPQHTDCATCPHNQFGSRGKGKACRNRARLAFVAPKDANSDTQILLLDMPPTSLKAWGSYVETLREGHGQAVMQVVTEIAFHPNEAFPTLIFAPADANPIKAEVMTALMQRASKLLEPE